MLPIVPQVWAFAASSPVGQHSEHAFANGEPQISLLAEVCVENSICSGSLHPGEPRQGLQRPNLACPGDSLVGVQD